MTIPLPVLFAAAAKIAQDERTHKVARKIFVAGSEALARRREAKNKEDRKLPSPPVEMATKATKPGKPSWRTAIERKIALRKGAAGDLIRLRYRDEHGLVTQRMVGNWASDGTVLTGFCLNMKAQCDFATAGIEQWELITVETDD